MLSNFLPRLPRRKLFLFLVPAAAAFIAGCATGNPQDTFDTAGPVAEDQANLFKFIFWIAVVVFVIVEAGIIWITLRYRRRSDSEMPVQTHGSTKLELTWTAIPALIIVAIAIPTVFSIWDLAEPPAGEEVMTVEAIGHQWWFEFRYPGEEIVTANELHVPVGKNVVVKLESQDVIHSFWVPRLFGKVDMVPTRVNELWFRADEPGEFFGQCAEFCGLAHALMRFRVIAEPEEDYNRWVAGMQTPPVAPSGGAVNGQSLFASNCSSCHSVDSYQDGGFEREATLQDGRWQGWLADIEDSRIVSAPNLTHFGIRTTLAAGIRDLDRDTLIKWIDDPSSIKSGTRMQEHAAVYQGGDGTVQLSNDEVADIADYLLSLVPGDGTPPPATATPATGGDPVALGETTFAANCSVCHSTSEAQIVGPGLAGLADRAGSRVSDLSADDYIRQSIKQPSVFVVEGFGPSMPPFPALKEAEIEGLLAYLKTLN